MRTREGASRRQGLRLGAHRTDRFFSSSRCLMMTISSVDSMCERAESHRYQLFLDRLRDHVQSSLDDDDRVGHREWIPTIDCSFYQTAESCQAISSFDSASSRLNCNRAISSPVDTSFRQTRQYLNTIRCKLLTRLMQRKSTGSELVRAFQQA